MSAVQGDLSRPLKAARGIVWPAAGLIVALIAVGCGSGGEVQPAGPAIGESPALKEHTSLDAITNRDMSLEEIIQRGEALFTTSFNTLDGAGRPETGGVNRRNNNTVISSRARREFPDNFNRISGPDANTCQACHSMPRMGGGGDNANNIFAMAERFDFVGFDGGEGDGLQDLSLMTVGVERNAPSIFGSGFIELLAREMTTELQDIAEEAIAEARGTGALATRDLMAKGVSFGKITARPDAVLDTSAVEGVDTDLVVRPFQQKGLNVSLREFAIKAMNVHFGMQASESFRDGIDADRDGVVDELTRGDITALVIFQATLPPPGNMMPVHPEALAAVARGKELFSAIGCAICHIPELRLNDPVFTEPNPFNPRGKLRTSDVSNPYGVDLTSQGPGPHLKREPDGSVLVPAFTDLKRHQMGDILDTDLLDHDGVPTDQWLTRKLWGFANEPPYLHHGRALLISEAILAHGGEGQASRDGFEALPVDDQAAVIEFLKTLQILPEESTELVVSAGVTASGRGAIWAVVGSGLAMLFLVAGVAAYALNRRRA